MNEKAAIPNSTRAMMPMHSRSLTFLKSANLAIRYAIISGGNIRKKLMRTRNPATIRHSTKRNDSIFHLQKRHHLGAYVRDDAAMTQNATISQNLSAPECASATCCCSMGS